MWLRGVVTRAGALDAWGGAFRRGGPVGVRWHRRVPGGYGIDPLRWAPSGARFGEVYSAVSLGSSFESGCRCFWWIVSVGERGCPRQKHLDPPVVPKGAECPTGSRTPAPALAGRRRHEGGGAPVGRSIESAWVARRLVRHVGLRPRAPTGDASPGAHGSAHPGPSGGRRSEADATGVSLSFS